MKSENYGSFLLSVVFIICLILFVASIHIAAKDTVKVLEATSKTRLGIKISYWLSEPNEM